MYVLLAMVGKNYYLMVSSVAVEYFLWCNGYCNTSGDDHKPCQYKIRATQFAVLSSIDSLGRVLIGPLAGSIQSSYGWEGLFFFSFLVGIFISILILIFRDKIKRMANLQ